MLKKCSLGTVIVMDISLTTDLPSVSQRSLPSLKSDCSDCNFQVTFYPVLKQSPSFTFKQQWCGLTLTIPKKESGVFLLTRLHSYLNATNNPNQLLIVLCQMIKSMGSSWRPLFPLVNQIKIIVAQNWYHSKHILIMDSLQLHRYKICYIKRMKNILSESATLVIIEWWRKWWFNNNNNNNNNNNSNIYWFVLCKYQSMERNFFLSITLASADLNYIPVMLYIPKGEQIFMRW